MNSSLQSKIDLLQAVATDEVMLDRMLGKLLHTVHDQYQRQLARYDQDIATFERRFQMPSEQFSPQFESGAMGDAMDFFEWAGLIELRDALRQKIQRLEQG